MYKVSRKNKLLIFDRKSRICVFFVWNLKKLLRFLKSIPLNFSIAKFHAKAKILKFRTKIALFGYILARIWKSHCHIWKQHLWIFLKAKLCAKNNKSLNLGPIMSYFGVFWLEFDNNIVTFEISALKYV